MGSKWPPSPERSRPSSPEAGFSLVEVLAALAIASLALIMSMQLLVQSARVDARLQHETAARDLARRLMAEAAVGRGDAGVLSWQATVDPVEQGSPLAVRSVAVTWPGGPVIATQRVEPAP